VWEDSLLIIHTKVAEMFALVTFEAALRRDFSKIQAALHCRVVVVVASSTDFVLGSSLLHFGKFCFI
jgi:hypothetical protein